MKIEITLDYADGDIENEILDRASKHVVEMAVSDPGLQRLVGMAREEMIREALAPMIQEAIEVPVKKTNRYGEPIGPKVTLRELVVETCKDILKAPRPAPFGQRGGLPLVHHLIREEVERTAGQEFKAALKEGKDKIRAALRDKGAEILQKEVAP